MENESERGRMEEEKESNKWGAGSGEKEEGVEEERREGEGRRGGKERRGGELMR